jgi:DNA repair exonuclease SbcCD ATPase subunit
MAINDVFEGKLIDDVEKLRSQFPKTKELYREVCSVMFFRYGIQPTANKLYQLVRKGTMSTPAQAVSNFWIELREKSRVAIEHPGLPDNVREVAGNAFSVIWNAALEAANQNLGSVKGEMDQLRARYEKEASEAAILLKKSHENTNQLEEEIRALKNELLEANKKILVDTEILANQNKTLLELKNDKSKLEVNLKNSQKDFSHEVNKMYESLKLSDERYRKLEAKTLIELDRERQHSASIEADLKQTIKAASKAQSSFNAQTAKSQKLINELRENIGLLKGQLKSQQKQNTRSKANVAS